MMANFSLLADIEALIKQAETLARDFEVIRACATLEKIRADRVEAERDEALGIIGEQYPDVIGGLVERVDAVCTLGIMSHEARFAAQSTIVELESKLKKANDAAVKVRDCWANEKGGDPKRVMETAVAFEELFDVFKISVEVRSTTTVEKTDSRFDELKKAVESAIEQAAPYGNGNHLAQILRAALRRIENA